MNQNNKKRPVLHGGEKYSKSISKRGGGKEKESLWSYDFARNKIIGDIKETKKVLKEMPRELRLPNEFVVSVRMDPAFTAKSFYPASLFDATQKNSELREVGSRMWRDDETKKEGKMFFLRATETGLSILEKRLNFEEAVAPKGFVSDVRKVRGLDLLTPDEQILGVSDEWEEGLLEFVLHPFDKDNTSAYLHFMDLVKDSSVNIESIRSKQYEHGVTFISLYGNRDLLDRVAGYNPLRTVHPYSLRKTNINRILIKNSAPLPPTDKSKSSIVLGVFDGGLQENNIFTSPYCENTDSVQSEPNPTDVQHGTMVAGAALYGALNDFGSTDILPHPPISVKSFRVSPGLDGDENLYEAIDAIEKIIPEQVGIYVYNISVGPWGPILDDHISRFTFACDLLAFRYNILFCVAVGNSGDESLDYLKRIQSPSDMVNGLAVGAFSYSKTKLIKAPYSCVGPGREGNKLKPDVTAFGGCDQSPMHLVSTDASGNCKDAACGTSFACPVVASKAAQLIGDNTGSISPLVARAMIIHTAQSDSKHDFDFGHGLSVNSVDDIVTCKPNSYTLIYQGEIQYGKYVGLDIPWLNEIQKGKVSFKWTTVVLSNVDPHSPDDYTTGSIVASLYVHSNKFIYKKDGKSRRLDLNIVTEALEASSLEVDGWKKSAFPVSVAGEKSYESESDLRKEMKWDTVDSRNESKNTDGVFNPFFHIHALSRGGRHVGEKIKFALVLTVETTEDSIDLYPGIVNRYDLLLPVKIEVENANQVLVSV